MLIANPIYDVVFKRMMENKRVAKFFIETLLEETIIEIDAKPQEFTYISETAKITVFRLDFIATIKTNKGEQKKILIEIQKARNHIDLMRFRNYLGEQYKKEDVVESEKIILPITTIYILGFKLPEITSPCIKVERNYKDLIEKKIINEKSDFVEKLTHDSFIVQVNRITNRFQTKLDKLLSIFEQSNFIDDSEIVKEYKHEVDNEDLKLTTDILHFSGTNPEERKEIEKEKEAWRSINVIFEDFQKTIKEKEEALQMKDQALSEKDQVLSEKDRLIEELMKKLNEKK
jgi:hypothetical protein